MMRNRAYERLSDQQKIVWLNVDLEEIENEMNHFFNEIQSYLDVDFDFATSSLSDIDVCVKHLEQLSVERNYIKDKISKLEEKVYE